MKKKYSIQILMLLMVTLFVGCSDDNDQQVDNLLQSRLAAKKILKGKWVLEKTGANKWSGPNTSLEFYNDSSVTYQSGETKLSGSYSILNFDEEFRDRDAFAFMLKANITGQEHQRYFFCHLWKDSLRLNDIEETSVLDNSHLYLKTK